MKIPSIPLEEGERFWSERYTIQEIMQLIRDPLAWFDDHWHDYRPDPHLENGFTFTFLYQLGRVDKPEDWYATVEGTNAKSHLIVRAKSLVLQSPQAVKDLFPALYHADRIQILVRPEDNAFYGNFYLTGEEEQILNGVAALFMCPVGAHAVLAGHNESNANAYFATDDGSRVPFHVSPDFPAAEDHLRTIFHWSRYAIHDCVCATGTLDASKPAAAGRRAVTLDTTYLGSARFIPPPPHGIVPEIEPEPTPEQPPAEKPVPPAKKPKSPKKGKPS